MYWHVETDIICLFILVLMSHEIRKRNFAPSLRDIAFKNITSLTIFITIVDIVSSLIMDFPPNHIVYEIGVFVYFFAIPFLPVYWYYYVCLAVDPLWTRRTKIGFWICCIPFMFYLFLTILTPFTGWLYSISSDMVYTRGSLFFLSVLIFIIYTCFAFVHILINYKNIFPRRRVAVLLSLPFFTTVGLIAQLTLPGVLTIIPSYAVCFVMIFFYIEGRRSTLDGLTGLLSRVSGEKFAKEHLDLQPPQPAAFIITDIDRFKRVNDSMGHIFGDKVLQVYGEALRHCLPNSYNISRLGGDEFVIFVPGFDDREQLLQELKQVGHHMKASFVLSEDLMGFPHITISMGISIFPQDGTTYMDLYENADIALHRAKSTHNGKIRFFDEE